MQAKVSIEIAAPPERVYALVSDVTRYGEWSPENLGGQWLDGAGGPLAGARFKAKNKRRFSWSTTSTVQVADAAREFSFITGKAPGGTVWRYALEPSPTGGTIVSESFETEADPGFVEKFLTKLGTGVRWEDRGADLERNMAATLDRLKTAAEAST